MSWLEKITFKGAAERFSAIWKRFPVAVAFTFIYTVIALLLIWNIKLIPDNDAALFMMLFYPPTALLLGVTFHLWSEEQAHVKRARIVHLVAQVCWLLYCLIISQQAFLDFSMELIIGLIAIVVLFKTSIFFLSFLDKKNDIEAWNFGWNIIIGALISTLVSGILLGGIELLLWGIQELFDLDLPNDLFLSMVIICMFTINILLLMMLVPSGEAKHNEDTNRMNDFGRVVVHALFVPLQGAYLITLYVYLLIILFRWELPSGGVVALVTTMMMGMLFITTLVYPLLFHDDKPFDKKLVRWLAILALPLLVLMSVGIYRRISDYGFTVARAYVVLFNIWCYVVCIYLWLKEKKRILWILVSFVLVFFIASVGPWNITAYTRRLLTRQVDNIFEKLEAQLPLDYARFDSLIQTMDRHDADVLKGKLSYLQFDLDEDSLVTRWLDGLVDLHTNPYWDGPIDIPNVEPTSPADIDFPSANMEYEIADMPTGNFKKVVQVSEWQYKQNVVEQDSVLYMDIDYAQDTLLFSTRFEIPFRLLQEKAYMEDEERIPFSIDNGDAVLTIMYFDVSENNVKDDDEEGEEEEYKYAVKDLEVKGLLFLREAAFNKEPLPLVYD